MTNMTNMTNLNTKVKNPVNPLIKQIMVQTINQININQLIKIFTK